VRATRIGGRFEKALTSEKGMMETGSETPRSREQGEKMVTIQPDTRFERLAAAAAHPLAELLECPQEAGSLLSGATRCVDFDAGAAVFRQHGPCKGLYVVVAGDFVRKAERFDMRVTLGLARPGDLVELAAALGDGHHTYTLTAVTSGSLLLLPIEALRKAFESYPALRMRLLEELAREVSRAYIICSLTRVMPVRRHGNGALRA
jgi:CRP-like cAMP-binding protein